MLEIRTLRSKKGIRVDLFRRYKYRDSVTEKIKFSSKQLGSFLLSQGYNDKLLTLLQPDETLQLENWLAEVDFAKKLVTEVDDLTKFVIRMPQKFHEALIKLFMECKRVGIEFVPYHIMLDSLLHKAIIAETKLDKINGFNNGILATIGLDPEQRANPAFVKEAEVESRQLFKALLALSQPVGRTCTELEQAALRYGKEKRIPPPQLKEWAGDMPNRNPNKPIKKWAYAIAIDVLLAHGFNPLTIEKPEKIAESWAMYRQKTQNLAEAKANFLNTFQVDKAIKPVVLQAIDKVYKKIS